MLGTKSNLFFKESPLSDALESKQMRTVRHGFTLFEKQVRSRRTKSIHLLYKKIQDFPELIQNVKLCKGVTLLETFNFDQKS